jgi:hypothetical protein
MMENKKDFCDIIPLDDIAIFYEVASEPVRRSISLLLQMSDRFYTYTSTENGEDNKVMCVLDEPAYCDLLYNVLFDFVQRYGHLQFFRILLVFLNSNTHSVTASMLHSMLTKHLEDKSDCDNSENLDIERDE